jgi:hypothetical protein
MNVHCVRLLTVIIAGSFFICSCGNKTNNNRKLLTFDSIKINRTEHLFGDSAKPYCNLIVNIAYPSISTSKILKDSLTNSILSLCLGNEYIGQTPQSAVKNYADKYLTRYRKELEPLYRQEDEASVLDWYKYYQSIIGRVQYNKHNLLTYRFDCNEYSGGIHNSYITNYKNFDIKRMKSLQLSDLFTGNYQNVLASIIVSQLMKDKGVSTKEELADKGYGASATILPTENFFIDSDGITFFYNVTEIAPYDLGAIKVFISFSSIKDIINMTELKSLDLL